MSSPPDDLGRAPTQRIGLVKTVVETRPGAPVPEAPALEASQQIGRFRVIEELGMGGMGVVYRAYDDELQRPVAIKLLLRDLSATANARERLRREAQAMAKVSHPNVVHVYEVGQHGDRVFLAMELIEGTSLGAWLRAKPRSRREILAVFLAAGEGLVAAHEAGLVHRDFKPDNVLVGRDGRPRVVDFGLARSSATKQLAEQPAAVLGRATSLLASLTVAGASAGTPAYMAPEQFEGRASDGRADQFAFCVALFEATVGRRPYQGNTVQAVREAVLAGKPTRPHGRERRVPAQFLAVLERGLQRDPEQRYPTMAALLAALRQATRRLQMRRRLGWAATVGTLATALVGLAIHFAPRSDAPPPVGETPDPNATILAASQLPEVLPTPLPGDPTGVTIHRLANGLTVYLCPRADVPRIQARIVLRVGAAYDPPQALGAAALAARLSENGTDRLGTRDFPAERIELDRVAEQIAALQTTSDPAKRGDLLQTIAATESRAAAFEIPGEYRRVLDDLGATAETEVDWDTTVVAADVPRARLGQWLQLESERLTRPVFRGLLREVGRRVHELAQRSALSTDEAALRALYPGSDWAHPVDGQMDTLANLPLDAVRAVHATWYAPNNAAIILVGDVSREAAVAAIEEAFGLWQPRVLPARPELPQHPPAPEALLPMKSEVAIFWRREPHENGDGVVDRAIARDLLQIDLYDAIAGLIGWDAYDGPYGAGLFLYGPAADLATAQDAVATRLSDLSANGIPEDRLVSSAAHRRFQVLTRSENDSQYARQITNSYGDRMAWSATVDILYGDRVPSVDEIQLGARAAASQTVTVRSAPADTPAPPQLPAVEVVLAPAHGYGAFAQQVLGMPVAAEEPQFIVEGRQYQVRRGAGGIAIAAQCDHGVEHTTIDITNRQGLGAENCGAFAAVSHLFLAPRGDRHDAPAGRIDCTSSSYTVRIDEPPNRRVWSIPPTTWLPTLEASLGQAELQRRFDVIRHRVGGSAWAGLQRQLLHGALLNYALWPSRHTVEFARLWKNRSTPTLSLQAWNQIIAQETAFLYCGPDPAGFLARAPVDTVRPPEDRSSATGEARRVPRDTVFVLHTDAADTVDLTFAWHLPPSIGTPSKAAVELLNVYLTDALKTRLSQGARQGGFHIDADVRFETEAEDKGGVLQAELSCPPHLAIDVLRSTREALTTGQIDEARFEQARAHIEREIRTTRIPNREIPDQVLAWFREGLNSDPRLEIWAQLPSTSPSSLQPTFDGIHETPIIITLMADPSQINAQSVAEFGEVKVLTADDLVAWDERRR